ncbi:YwdI family protein [Ureibacillus sp. MALMAid1270]|uniref:YwdI family protein n=1 Tax=Ureibacillus sp. MALMAid1270 TaxID=3411629 RepID=UPI003BA7C21E
MISFQTLLLEIEKHTNIAKNTVDEQQIREQIIAIRTLCEVALAEKQSNINMTKHSYQETHNAQSVQLNTKMSMSSERLIEDGANGNSIFDF